MMRPFEGFSDAAQYFRTQSANQPQPYLNAAPPELYAPQDVVPYGMPSSFLHEPEAESPCVLTVHNVLASATLKGCPKLDLDKSCLSLGNSYYNPAEFPALRIDVRGQRNALYTLSLFESGRIQSAGGCRPSDAKKAMIKIGKRLNSRLGYSLTLENFEIQNILAVFDSECSINLQQFIQSFDGYTDYEPERFPAARVRIPIPSKDKESSNTTPEATPEVQSNPEVKTSVKLRRLMMGGLKEAVGPPVNEFDEEDEGDLIEEGVGTYIIGSGAKRNTSTRQKETTKEEVVTANVFSTGKITLTGAKAISSLNFALERLKPFLGFKGSGVLVVPPQHSKNADKSKQQFSAVSYGK